MTYPEWPIDLPYRPWRDMWNYVPGREALQTEMEGGDTRQRRRPGDDVGVMQWGRTFTEAEMATWDGFLSDTSGGVARFIMPVPTNGAIYQLRVVQIVGGAGGVSLSAVGVETQVSFSLVVFPADMVPPTPTIHVFDTLIMGEATTGETVDVEIDGVVRSAVAADGVFVIDGAGLVAGVHSVVRVRYAGSNYGPQENRTLTNAFVGAMDALAASSYEIYASSRVLTSWLLPVMLARRSSDSATKAFYAISSSPWLVDPLGVSIAAWAGAGSAYVQTWYGQKAASHDATQATGASQPRIVNSGVLDVGPNGRPMLVWSGAQTLHVQNALGFARAADALTMASSVNITNGAALPFIFASTFTTAFTTRAALGATGTAARVLGRRLSSDAQAAAQSAGGVFPGWRRQIGRILYTAATADISIDGVTVSSAFLAPGAPSQDVDSTTAPTIGSIQGVQPMSGQMAGVVLARTSLDIAALDAALAQVMP